MCMTKYPKATAWTDEALRVELDRYENDLRTAGKARNTVTTYVQPVERFLNWLAGQYRPRPGVSGAGASRHDALSRGANRSGNSRYNGLREYLSRRTEAVVRLSFVEIERIIGGPLPASARRYRPWWANEQSGTHVHARSWLDAGRRTSNVDLKGATVDFVT